MTDQPRSKINWDTFHEYRDYCAREDCFLLCTGPSLLQFDIDFFVGPYFTVGVNEAVFHYPNLNFLFVQDTKPTHEHGYANKRDVYNHAEYPKLEAKFAGKAPYIPSIRTIPWEDINKHGWLPYEIGREGLCEFEADIDTYCLGDGNSVAFSAAQWALFTGITTLYLVGVDITPRNTILDEPPGDFHPYLHWDHLGKWKAFKLWSKTHYPKTNIVSVNPVGLKGLFEEIEI